jgi:hypothetical protein
VLIASSKALYFLSLPNRNSSPKEERADGVLAPNSGEKDHDDALVDATVVKVVTVPDLSNEPKGTLATFRSAR